MLNKAKWLAAAGASTCLAMIAFDQGIAALVACGAALGFQALVIDIENAEALKDSND